MLKDDVEAGNKRIVQLIKPIRDRVGTVVATGLNVSKGNLPVGENVLLTVPDQTWAKNNLIELSFGLAFYLGAQSPAGASAP